MLFEVILAAGVRETDGNAALQSLKAKMLCCVFLSSYSHELRLCSAATKMLNITHLRAEEFESQIQFGSISKNLHVVIINVTKRQEKEYIYM